jgi:predicted extracellular nuclease
MGLAEVENAGVLNTLLTASTLSNYAYVHYDSPDERGIDVAFIYKKSSFIVTHSRVVPVDLTPQSTRPTRDILHIEGNLFGEKIHILVNHWPSRSSGQVATNPLRAAAAKTAKSIADEITSKDSTAKIILMGDLNDNPTDKSLVTHLGAKNIKSTLTQNDLYNPYFTKFKKGYGTQAYQDVWSNFDQILVSNNLVQAQNGYKFIQEEIFNKSFLIQQFGRYKGYPLRTNNDTGSMGYSDHLPVYVILDK